MKSPTLADTMPTLIFKLSDCSNIQNKHVCGDLSDSPTLKRQNIPLYVRARVRKGLMWMKNTIMYVQIINNLKKLSALSDNLCKSASNLLWKSPTVSAQVSDNCRTVSDKSKRSPDMWTITCGICKHEDDAERFFTGQHHRYACPHCGTVWNIQHQGKAVVTESGFVIPPRKVCVVEPQMMLVAR